MIQVSAQLCSGCRRCEVACAAHWAEAGRPAASCVFVLKDETAGADIPLLCRSCEDRPCVEACRSGALAATMLPSGDWAVRFSRELCTGCGACTGACPFGVVEMRDGFPLICDLCGGEPRCVAACNLDALGVRPGPGPAGAPGNGRDAPPDAPADPSPASRRLRAARAAARRLPWLVPAGRPEPFAFIGSGGGSAAGPGGGPAARGPATFGYAGSVLRVDLDRMSVATVPLDMDFAGAALGGRGFNSLRLLEELPAGTDALSPQSLLMVGIGPLTGTALPACSRFTVTAKSPQTGLLGDGNAGGHFAAELKFAGFDQIVVSGRAREPVYLLIAGGAAWIRPAPHLWSGDVWQTTDAIRRELGEPGLQVLTIGRPAELGVRFAGVVSGHSRAAARTGVGAVMGSKRLKAIAVLGGGGPPPVLAEPAAFGRLVAGLEKDILAHPGFERRKQLGTTALMSALQSLGILPTRHFQEGLFEGLEQVSGERLAATFKVKHKACYNCPVHCSRFCVLPDGTMAEGPEYETLCGFTSRIGNDDLVFALRMAAEVNRQGLDSISLTEAIGWLMECRQRGLVSASETDGLDLTWGNRKAIAALVDKVVRREGIGDLLAGGALAAARRLGRGSEALVMHVKGLDVICGDPRGIKGYGLTYAIASRGADHLRAEPFFELSGDRELARERFGTADAADRLAWKGKARLVNYTEEIAFLTDALTMCKNVGLCMDILSHERAADLVRAATGMDAGSAGLRRVAGRVLDAERAFNLREGLDPAADTLPARFLDEPLAAGPSSGQVVELDRMLPEYYRLRGWGPDGRPLRRGGREDAQGRASGRGPADIC